MGGVGVGGQDSQQNDEDRIELHIEASVGALKSEGVIITTVIVMLLASVSYFFIGGELCGFPTCQILALGIILMKLKSLCGETTLFDLIF